MYIIYSYLKLHI